MAAIWQSPVLRVPSPANCPERRARGSAARARRGRCILQILIPGGARTHTQDRDACRIKIATCSCRSLRARAGGYTYLSSTIYLFIYFTFECPTAVFVPVYNGMLYYAGGCGAISFLAIARPRVREAAEARPVRWPDGRFIQVPPMWLRLDSIFYIVFFFFFLSVFHSARRHVFCPTSNVVLDWCNSEPSEVTQVREQSAIRASLPRPSRLPSRTVKRRDKCLILYQLRQSNHSIK